MFALWYLSLAVDEIRKRVNCPANLCPQKTAQTIPEKKNDPPPKIPAGDQPAAAAKPTPPSVPLKPVEPIQIPKDTPNEDERLKQLESPETVELIKTFEMPDPMPDNNRPSSEQEKVTTAPAPQPPVKPTPTPPVVAVKPQPIVAPLEPQPPKAPSATDPSDSLFNPPPTPPSSQMPQPGGKPSKDIKEATSDFLAQEYSQPKKSSKRYTKTSRQKNNHS